MEFLPCIERQTDALVNITTGRGHDNLMQMKRIADKLARKRLALKGGHDVAF